MPFIFPPPLDLDEKQVLRNVSGEFHARELSAIMGEFFYNFSYQKNYFIFYCRSLGVGKVKSPRHTIGLQHQSKY